MIGMIIGGILLLAGVVLTTAMIGTFLILLRRTNKLFSFEAIAISAAGFGCLYLAFLFSPLKITMGG